MCILLKECQGVDYTPRGMRVIEALYIYHLTKYTEFLDTIFFLLRKKFHQVSILHVYHHAIMPFHTWILLRFLPNGYETFAGVLNCVIHIIMYSYYLLASFGPHMQKYLWWKRYLTQFQIVQFIIVVTRSLMVVLGIVDCYPWQHSLWSLCVVLGFLVLFSNYYIQEYLKKKNDKYKKFK